MSITSLHRSTIVFFFDTIVSSRYLQSTRWFLNMIRHAMKEIEHYVGHSFATVFSIVAIDSTSTGHSVVGHNPLSNYSIIIGWLCFSRSCRTMHEQSLCLSATRRYTLWLGMSNVRLCSMSNDTRSTCMSTYSTPWYVHVFSTISFLQRIR
jgi:hypothetical protein